MISRWLPWEAKTLKFVLRTRSCHSTSVAVSCSFCGSGSNNFSVSSTDSRIRLIASARFPKLILRGWYSSSARIAFPPELVR